FQGAYVYHFNLEDGFELKGKITHLSDEDYAAMQYNWYGYEKNVERIIFIGETLYTISGSEIRASDLETLEMVNNLMVKQDKR
ncbi:MAG: beta-propeller domain-containing protein, partial [Dethiobacteria bacterium]